MHLPQYEGLQLIPSKSAMRELFEYSLDLYDVAEVLENGYDCPRSKRKKDTVERCMDLKQKTLRIVIVKSVNFSLDSEVWVITHVGLTAKPGV